MPRVAPVWARFLEGGRGRRSLHSRGRWLARVVQAGGYAIHGRSDSVVQSGVDGRICDGALAAQQIDLDETERIDVVVAHVYGTQDYRILFQQFFLASDGEDGLAGAFEFLLQHGEDAIAEGSVGYEIGVEAG